MIPPEELERLQYRCKGAGGENLYRLIGEKEARLDHGQLRDALKKKKNAWQRDTDKDPQRIAVETALRLLRTPADKAEYDRFLESQAEPQAPAPPVRPSGHQPPPPSLPPMRPPGNQPQPRPASPPRGAGLSNAKLVAVGLALVALSLLMTVPWGDRSPDISVETARSEAATGAEAVGGPTEAGSANERRTPPSGSSSRDSSRTTGAEPGRPVPRAGRDADPGTAAPVAARSGVGAGAEAAGVPVGGGGASEGRTPPSESPSRDTPRSTRTESSGPAPTPGRETDPGTRPSNTRPSIPVDPTAAPEDEAAGAGARSGVPTEAPATAGLARADAPPVAEPVRVGGNVARPRKTWNVQPEYPRLARLRRVQGIAILEVTVDRQGNVSNVSVLRSDAEGFGEAAVEAVRQWRYEPTIMDGRPVSVILTDTVRFQP